MESETTNLYIDALTYRKNKAFGYNEYLFNLLNYFYDKRCELKFDKVFIVCEDTQKSDFLTFASRMEVISFSFKTFVKRVYIQSLWNFIIQVQKNDVILFTSNYSTYFKRCKHILVIHDLLYLHGNLLKNNKIKYQRKLMVPISIMLADKIIAISDFTRNEIINNFPHCREKIETIYNHFNLNKFAIKDIKLPRGKNIISVASNAYHKNTITLLKAFLEYKKRGGKLKLVLIGALKKGSSEKDLFNYILNLFPNSIQNKVGITNSELGMEYWKGAIYVSTSFFEGLGMPIVEAMYFRLNLILPEFPAIFREVSGNNAFYFDSKDYWQLSSLLLSCESLTNSYPEYAIDKFNAANTSGRYVFVLNNI